MIDERFGALHIRTSLTAMMVALALPAALSAQTAPQAPEEQTQDTDASPTAGDVAAPLESDDAATESDEQEIVVTGSRIARPETDFPNPIISLTAAQIEQSGDTNLVDFLVDSPALIGSTTTANTSGTSAGFGNAGLNLLNLRNLGEQRTLTLVDGRRHVASNPGTAAVDVNSIPTDLVERVDVLTGGTSAIYGADGVSGVVNFVLKRNFDGIRARGQIGTSERGDAGQRFGSVTVGKNFADDRGNVALAYQYNDRDNLRFSDRPQGRALTSISLLRDPGDRPDDPTRFDRVLVNDVRYADSSPEGAIDLGEFDADGNFGPSFVPTFNGDGRLFDRGRLLPGSGGLTQGGSSTAVADYSGDLILGSRQHIVNGLASFRFSPALRVFGEAKYVKAKVSTIGQPSFDFFTFIAADNPFIPANVRAGLVGPGLFLSRDNFDLGIRGITSDRETLRGVIGADGRINDDFRYEVSYTYGQSKVRGQGDNSRITDRYFAALDAVVNPANGQIVCRSNLDPSAATGVTFTPGPNSGCAPLNFFGSGVASQAALDFVLTDTVQKSKLTQNVVSGFVTGDTGGFFSLPGGPIGLVVGAEYREEKSRSRPDRFQSEGLLLDTSEIEPNDGKFDVKEAFAEINIPILKGVPFAETLLIGGAVRFSDYSTIGSTFTYQGSGVYAPIRDVSFRGTYSQSVRAPNIDELFATQSGSFQFIDDPCDPSNIGEGSSFRVANCNAALTALGVNPSTFSPTTDPQASASILGRAGGNPDLNEETARTWTAGVVLRPTFLRGFTAALDYYDIKLKDAINESTAQQNTELCVDQPTLDNVFCRSITRAARTGFVSDFLTGPQNVANFRTAGADLVLNYQFQPSTIGTFNLRVVGGYLDKLVFISSIGAEPDDDRREALSPRFSGTADLTWTKGPVTLNYGVAYQDKTRRFTTEQLRANPDLSDPRFFFFKERLEHDFQASFAVQDRFTFYTGVNNLTDEKPDVASSDYPYCPIGRYFYAGARIALGDIF